MTEPSDPQALAEACAEAMYERDYASKSLGIVLDAVRPGFSQMSMTVSQTMVNGHALCHGGLIFTLADTAFAYACNSRNQSTVAARCSIDFIAPARLDDVLTAVAEERTLSGRTGIYDIIVRNQHKDLVALFRGNSYRIRGEVVTERRPS